MSTSEGGSSRDVTTVNAPDGVEYTIVTAMRGTPLRGTSVTYDFTSLVFELVWDLVAPVIGGRSEVRKVGVFEVRPRRIVRLRFKSRVGSSREAQGLVQDLAQEIQRGELRWERTAGK
jgi:hypothetical protein